MTSKREALVASPPLVEEPALIRVLTIKSSFVEQMTQYSFDMKEIPDDLSVIGKTKAFVIVRLPVGNGGSEYAKIHRTDFMKWLMRDSNDYKVALQKAQDQLRGYPQLFEE